VKYQGIRDFRTAEPGQLRQDLQRQNQAIEQAFFDAELERARFSVRKTNRDDTVAFRELLLVDVTSDVVVRLPSSSPETKGLPCRIGRTVGGGTLMVAAVENQTVQGGVSASLPNIGWAEFIDDGAGGFWSRPL